MFPQASWQKRLENLIEGGGRCYIFGLGALTTSQAILGGAGISAAGSLAGGKKSANAATQAAQIQANEEQQALSLQQAIYQNNANNLNPYIQFGTSNIPALQTAVNAASTPFQPTMAQIAGMPGYQFTQSQIQQQVANAGSATGPGGATNYQLMTGAGNIASTYEQQYFNQWLQGNQLNLTAAATPVQTGLSAAGALAGVGVASGANMANTLGNIGSALASGTVGSANALTAGLSGSTSAVGGGLSNLALLNALGAGGTAAGSPINTSPAVIGSDPGSAGTAVYPS